MLKFSKKKLMTIIFVCIRPSYIILKIQRQEGAQCDPDKVAHIEPPHPDQRCSQIKLFSDLARLYKCTRRAIALPPSPALTLAPRVLELAAASTLANVKVSLR